MGCCHCCRDSPWARRMSGWCQCAPPLMGVGAFEEHRHHPARQPGPLHPLPPPAPPGSAAHRLPPPECAPGARRQAHMWDPAQPKLCLSRARAEVPAYRTPCRSQRRAQSCNRRVCCPNKVSMSHKALRIRSRRLYIGACPPGRAKRSCCKNVTPPFQSHRQ